MGGPPTSTASPPSRIVDAAEMQVAGLGGDETLQWHADGFGLGIAEQSLGGWVPQDDLTGRDVGRHDRLRGQPEQPADAERVRVLR